MCVLGVGVSSGWGRVLVVWARGQCAGSVMIRAVFGAQLPSSQLPAAACVDTMSHVGTRPSNGGRYLLSYQVRSLKNVPTNSTQKNGDNKTCM